MQPEWKEEFSSFESRVPIVLQNTFVFPLPVTGLGITLTQHGITSKNILVATALGQVFYVLSHRGVPPPRLILHCVFCFSWLAFNRGELDVH